MPRVVGLDLGRRCGYAIADSVYLRGWRPRSRLEGPRPSNACLSYDEWRLGDQADLGTVYGRLWERLSELHAALPIDLLVVESAGTNFKSEAALMSIVGLVVVSMTWAKMFGVAVHLVHNNQVKKHGAGHGWAEKAQMVAAAEALGWSPKTENAADALFVLDLGLTRWQTT